MRLWLGGGVVVVAGVGLFVIVMQPTSGQRVAMGLIFALMAAGTIAAALWLPRLAKGNRSLSTTVMALSVVSFVIVVFGLLAAGQQMFISPHDLTLLLIVVGFGVVAAVAFAVLVSGPLTGELGHIAETASAMAAGDLSQRTSTTRSDEVGDLARAINEMASALQVAEMDRERDDRARRDLFAAVGHDLRTPLASLQVAIEAIQDELADEPDRYLDSMRSDTEALARLVDDLFLLARLESRDIDHAVGPVDLAEVADEAVEVFRPLCDERELVVNLEMVHRVVVRASSEGMARVVRNLLDNAVRHSPSGGTIQVSISNGSTGIVEIRDQGPGFPREFIDRAFERGTRDDQARSRSYGGAGLGLAIASRYVDDFGGRIWATPGPGGLVTVELPLARNAI
ncbi:MAG: HAMP domain-containing sensor histidine kinase [Acidimicrobiia bacterium]